MAAQKTSDILQAIKLSLRLPRISSLEYNSWMFTLKKKKKVVFYPQKISSKNEDQWGEWRRVNII